MRNNVIYDCIVVGGGASGMFFCANVPSGYKVALIEKNNIFGKKLLITGKGRCNVTNNSDRDTFIKNVRVNPNFLYSAYSAFSSDDTMSYFENSGVPLKTERGNRVFPVSDKSSDIVSALEKNINAEKIFDEVVSISKDNDVFSVATKNGVYLSKNVVIATGGKSYPKTGSTGDGYRFAEKFGHTVAKIKPSLVPLEVYEKEDCLALQGLSLKNVSIKVLRNEKNIYSDFGEMIFTHFGVSGPIILSASAFTEVGDKIIIDLKPALDEKQLDKRILSDFEKYKNKNFSNALSDLLPSKIISEIIKRTEISPYKKVNTVTAEERKKLVLILKNFTLTVSKTRPISEAIITSGGVSVKDIDPKTMQSKITNGLYFVGEVLDVDAYTGGFNLQIAFSTAYLAVKNIFK